MELYDVTLENFGPYEKFTLPLYKQGLVWVGGENKDTASANSNGSGKSTIFKAISWALYGESIDGEKGDKVIKNGATRAVVDVRLIDSDGKFWTVNRQRSKGAPRLSLFDSSGKEFQSDKQTLQDKINSMVGLDFNAFRNTIMYGQNDVSRFANPKSKDSDRKEILHKILNTQLLELCHLKVMELSKTLKNTIKDLESNKKSLALVASEYDLQKLVDECQIWERDREAELEDWLKEIEELKIQARKLLSDFPEMEIPDVEKIKNDIKICKKALSKLEDKRLNYADLNDEINELELNYGVAVADVSDSRKTVSVLNEHLEDLDGDICHVCHSSLKTGGAAKHISGLKRKLEKSVKEKDENEKLLIEIELKLKDKRKERTKLEDLNILIHNKIDALAYLKDNLAEANQLIKDAEHAKEKNNLLAKSKIDQAKKIVDMVKRKREETNPYVSRLNEARERLDECSVKINNLDDEIKSNSDSLSYYEFWQKGFSNQGLPSYILDAVMPFITERANYYLEILSDGDLTMEFSTQRELKSSKGTMKDEIDIRWSIEGVDMYPPSGGQLKKMEIATDLALMDMVASNEGAALGIMMLDEVFDGLDAEGISRVFDLLKNLRSKRGSIFVISHAEKMAEIFEKGIKVVKNNGVASLEII